jgi:hypothetical protein
MNDDRKFLDDKNDYEPFENFIKTKLINKIKILSELEDYI